MGWWTAAIKHLKGCQGAGPAPARFPLPSVPELALLTWTQVSSFAPSWGALNLYDGQLYVPTDWAKECPDSWKTFFLAVCVRVLLEETSI